MNEALYGALDKDRLIRRLELGDLIEIEWLVRSAYEPGSTSTIWEKRIALFLGRVRYTDWVAFLPLGEERYKVIRTAMINSLDVISQLADATRP